MPLSPIINGHTLHEVEQHFAEVVANVEDQAIFLLDPQGIVVSWNAGAKRIKGYDSVEIIGRSFTSFYTSDALEAGWPQEELRRAREVGRFQDEGWRVCKDGTMIWANVVITAIRSPAGELRGFLKIMRDLTERKKAEETLRESEERFRLMIESVQDYAIFMLDPQGHIASWNAGAKRIKGYSADEIIGKHYSTFYSAEDVASGRPHRQLEMAIQEGRIETEGWRLRKDGSLFWANVVITALHDEQGNLRGFAKITRDMTESQKIAALQFADQQKNAFLAMLAHELRNPLAPIRNGIELLKMVQTEDPIIAETREMMDRQIMHLVRLVDDLLDMSRIVNGKIHLAREACDLSTVIDRAVEEIAPLMQSRGHVLKIERPGQPVVVNGDLVRLSQVVSNLLSNAAKFTEVPGEVWLSLTVEGDDAVLRIRDFGIGIEAEELPRIFKLFEQGNVSLARSRGGLGIGLTLVRRIVDLHGGSVTAGSEGPDRGTEFAVRIPLHETLREEASVTPPPVEKRGPQVRRRILVVDDNVDAATSVGKLLEHWGHEVAMAFGGAEAIAKAKAMRPEYVLLDLGMPGIDGYEVAKQLRAENELRPLVIAALTGYGHAEHRAQTKEAGFDYHLTKPPSPEALAALFRTL